MGGTGPKRRDDVSSQDSVLVMMAREHTQWDTIMVVIRFFLGVMSSVMGD